MGLAFRSLVTGSWLAIPPKSVTGQATCVLARLHNHDNIYGLLPDPTSDCCGVSQIQPRE